jgi:hypothetical protein
VQDLKIILIAKGWTVTRLEAARIVNDVGAGPVKVQDLDAAGQPRQEVRVYPRRQGLGEIHPPEIGTTASIMLEDDARALAALIAGALAVVELANLLHAEAETG